MLCVPDDVFSLIVEFAWGKKLSKLDLYVDLHKVSDIQDCVPPFFLNVVCYDCELNTWVPSPFRSTYPYVPTMDLDSFTFWSNTLEYLPGVIHTDYYRREKTYRSVFVRHIRQMKTSGFELYNFLLARYFGRIQNTDLPDHDDFTRIRDYLALARPILKSF